MDMTNMTVHGMKASAVRDNLWGTYWIIPGGANEQTGNDGHAVYVERWIVPDGNPHKFRKLAQPEVKLFLCGSYEQAQTRMKFEATRYKQYRMITYRGEDF
jgi:hypothetical protein